MTRSRDDEMTRCRRDAEMTRYDEITIDEMTRSRDDEMTRSRDDEITR